MSAIESLNGIQPSAMTFLFWMQGYLTGRRANLDRDDTEIIYALLDMCVGAERARLNPRSDSVCGGGADVESVA
jgi:hypothetical protein